MTSQIDYQGASAEAIQSHYDRGNDFYALWLDPTRSYSCALWQGPDDTLRAAQERKLDHLATGARVRGAGRVLDVGCGWGGMMRRLVDTHDVSEVVGLTLANEQAAHIATFADARYDVRVQNWVDHAPGARDGKAPYDAIVSIGAFEHFADFGLARAGRVAAYRRFFDSCAEWLPPGGRLALQTNVKGNNVKLDRKTVKDLLFICDQIFPESELPWVSEIFEASERRFDLVSARNDADHYARTCQEWHDNLVANRAAAVAMVGEQRVADYERYLRASVDGFRNRHLGLVRIVFERT
ncbi:MAG: methyltransferase [Actinophytocola sp.]|uniref:SAM-dependent methyltransferase n=1 Tax=Actinophytocola sp. TaxID=1872138 RepID=UPI0013242473|nr:cyclopropane-fatty-acyl-phospholipid synthase family protein [Actinophytocola sp.]MPZ79427.1 methyltransferase [Actinophytocola sp.]